MPEPLSDEDTLKWCEGCPLDKRHNMETLDCGAYKLRWPQWPRWDGSSALPVRLRRDGHRLSSVGGSRVSSYLNSGSSPSGLAGNAGYKRQ